MTLTVVVWKWRGWRGDVYKAEHVLAMAHMVKQNLHMPHRFVCVTDDPTGLESIETMPIWNYPDINTGTGRPNCYRRLRLFAPEAASMFGERVLSLDLDAVILGDITHLITDDDFKIVKGKAAPYNGSMFLHKTGTRPHVWEKLNRHAPDVIARHERISGVRHYGSDQAWMSYQLPCAPVWTEAEGVYHFTLLNEGVPPNARLLFFAGGNKPWSERARQNAPEAFAAYRAAAQEVKHDRPRIRDN